jgi:hypothetical protein
MGTRFMAAGLLALLAMGAGPPPARAAVDVAIKPTVQTVAPGAEFEVTLQVTNASSAFNGFHALVGYDPLVLTPVPLTPTKTQVGSLISSVCSSLYHTFHAGQGRDSIDVAMLCGLTRVSGPGTIYRLRFRAANTVQATTLRLLPGVQFADTGLWVPTGTMSDAAVGIGMTPTLDVPNTGPSARTLVARPNPASGAVVFALGRPAARSATLRVLDLQGRMLRSVPVSAGENSVRWDGRDAAGRSVPPGAYLVSLEGDGAPRSTRVLVLR